MSVCFVQVYFSRIFRDYVLVNKMFINVSNLTLKNTDVQNVEKTEKIDVQNVETCAEKRLFLNTFHNIVYIIFEGGVVLHFAFAGFN